MPVNEPNENLPEPRARVSTLMSDFGRQWWLCGGWAVDGWLGRVSRDHHDVDISVFHEDQRAIFEHLAGWKLVGHDDNVADDSPDPWDGRQLDLPAHIHARSADGFELEIILNERAGDDWVISREPRITKPIGECVQLSPWGVLAVAPDVALFYKALPPAWRDSPRAALRPHDELDFAALLPELTATQRQWLREAISLVEPGHPWLGRL